VTDVPSPPPRGLDRVVLAGEALTRLNPLLDADRAQAVADLEAENCFALCGTAERVAVPGPYVLHLSVQEGRLVFDVRNAADAPLQMLVLALGPFRGLIKDYQMLVDSHMTAIEEGREPGHRHGPPRPAQRGRDAAARAAAEQGHHRPRDGTPPVHPGVRAAPADLGPKDYKGQQIKDWG